MSLYPLLWLVKVAWRLEQQSANQQNIMKTAGLLVERLEKYAEAFGKLGERIAAVDNAYADARRVLTESPQSVAKTGQRIATLLAKEAPKLASLAATEEEG